jgi:cysteinyl-tRNA synthetase
MQAHYRNTLDFTSEALNAAEKGFEKLMLAIENLLALVPSSNSSINTKVLVDGFYAAMDDDFNAPALVACLFDAVKQINAIVEGRATINKDDLSVLQKEISVFVFEVLGLRRPTEKNDDQRLSNVMALVLELRGSARENKDWITSDKIRDGLSNAGIIVSDGKDGASWK